MKNIFRWQGLIAFMLIIGGLAALVTLLADSLVQTGIEAAGTRLNGAKVEIDRTELSFFPLGVEVSRLQVTDPEQPMKNAVDVRRLNFSLSPLDLVRRKIIINEMAVDDVRFNTDRTTSGALSKKAAVSDRANDKIFGFQLPSFDVEDVKAILAKEPLKSLEEAERLKQAITAEKEKFEARLKELPDKEKMDRYEIRIKALKGRKDLASALTGIKELNDILKNIRTDIALIRQTRDDVRASARMLREQTAVVAQSPGEDIRRLTEKYGPSPRGAGNITALVFGPRYGQWVETGLTWYQKLQPLLAGGDHPAEAKKVRPERGRGVNVRFPERQPLPDFLIRRAAVSITLAGGVVSGDVRDITSEQPVLGRPLTYAFSSEQMKNMTAIDISGQLNHVKPGQARDSMNVSARGIQIVDFPISRDKGFPLTLSRGTADGLLETVVDGRGLGARAEVTVRKTAFVAAPEESLNRIEQAVIERLAAVSGFTLNALAKGTIDDFKVDLDSNLDDVVKEAVKTLIGENLAEFKSRLKAAVLEKTDGPIRALKNNIGALDLIEQELNERLRMGDQTVNEIAGGN